MKHLTRLLDKIRWRRVAWMCAGVFVAMLSLQAVDYRDVQKVRNVDIRIDRSTGLFFMDSASVTDILGGLRVYPGLSLVQSVPTAQLEKVLEASPYCDNAEVYIDATGTLHVELRQRIPIVRIINTRGVGYYLCPNGVKLPLSDKFTARVLAVNGHVRASDNNADTSGEKQLQDVLRVALALQSDTFLSRLTDQVWVNPQGEFVLVPKFVRQEVLLGNADELDRKLSKLSAFYRHTARTTLAFYKTINLKYKNEIYATRRETATQKAAAPPAVAPAEQPNTQPTPH